MYFMTEKHETEINKMIDNQVFFLALYWREYNNEVQLDDSSRAFIMVVN